MKMKKRLHKKKQISLFNAACFALAAFLFSFSILVESPDKLTLNAENMLANAVGAFAAVPANPYNTLAAALEKKESDLIARESAVEILEGRENSIATYSFMLSTALFLLLAANFYFDWRRARKSVFIPTVVPRA